MPKLNPYKKATIIILAVTVAANVAGYLNSLYPTPLSNYIAIAMAILFYFGVLLSFINTFIISTKYKAPPAKKMLWVLLSALPWLYILAMTVYTYIQGYQLVSNLE
ncbi:hypothetical protein M0G43_12740 [Subsaxibacter sp. CAU 1640]|uniref:hypothetical protein n=1 Tax=Subsaxibacter sp. CAU 1640 TaxID=2933271 RepID=UPI0020058118|nr:hypothetical protein [Subsaxibacter sp. CAU 1640]MCK7591446.1 hypothetical protein [Subsaxibacter sp. CAU 1640]